MDEGGALVAGLGGLGVLGPLFDGRFPLPDPDPSRVLESQQTAPRSHKLAGSLTTTEGWEQNADIKPGRQTPGQRLSTGATDVVELAGASVVVVVVEALESSLLDGVVEVVVEATAVVLGGGFGEVVEFLAEGISSRRVMQHLPPLAH